MLAHILDQKILNLSGHYGLAIQTSSFDSQVEIRELKITNKNSKHRSTAVTHQREGCNTPDSPRIDQPTECKELINLALY